MGLTSSVPNSILQPGVCTSTTRPAAPYNGQVVYETDTNKTLFYNGTAWVILNDPNAVSIDASGNVTFDNDVTVTGTITSVGNPQGLVLVKSQTIGTAVSSVTVNNAFSSTFDNYFITMNGGTLSNDVDIFFRVGSATTGYYWALNWVNAFTGAGPTSGNGNNVGYFIAGGGSVPNLRFNVMGPYLSASTEMDAIIRYSAVYGNTVGIQADATSHTSFTLYPYNGTMTGGTIRVYGYAQ